MNKIKVIIAGLLASFGIMSSMVVPAMAVIGTNSTTSTGAINCGTSGNLTGTGCESTTNADSKVQDTIKLVIQIFQIIVGLISVIMIIVGGLKYVTSGGDSGGVTGAKNTILYAVIGLVVVALAQVVVQFVLNRVNTQTQL